MNIFQKLYHRDLEKTYKEFSGVILDNIIGDIPDLQAYFVDIKKEIDADTKILISYHNPSWETILTLASKLGLRKNVGIQNWLDQDDLKNILELSGFEVVSSKKRFFGITTVTIAQSKLQITKNQITKKRNKNYSVSIVIPARNEAGNIPKIIPSIPKFGKWQEIIFVEGNSTDHTWSAITNLQLDCIIPCAISKQFSKSNNPIFKRTIKAYKQKGKGKADAVWVGFEKAKGDILMIYDADRTVDAKDLPKFYNALVSGLGKFANGSRMIYPMENQAMQSLNKIGNKVFGSLFTWILGQRFKDTLCGTKALFRKDYVYMRKHNKGYFKMDPFGDFALIFGAIKNNLKVIEIPVRYKERQYGSTNISRFRHGLILLRMTIVAFKEFKL
jgi:glycosyltransferase involved in cell wall biosynthesis